MQALSANTLREILNSIIGYLGGIGIDNPSLNAEILMMGALKCKRVSLHTDYGRCLTGEETEYIWRLVQRRASREPLQYITGMQGFWSLEFKVTPDVLIPRPETELLIEEALKVVSGQLAVGSCANRKLVTANYLYPCPLILDLCTGSGCIAVTLAREIPHAVIYATDISESALEIAKENAKMHGVLDRIKFIHGDLFNALDPKPLTPDPISFDIIVSNPPYIRTKDIENLEPEVKGFEPLEALDGGRNGLDVIRKIIEKSHIYLKKDGILMFEIGAGQAVNVMKLFESSFNYKGISIIKDYSGIERVVKAQRI
ncbi:MAG: protein-(glutamine-N5) methyltransferase, release factor-specific [Deltaproteobacteria bacterium GWC2_42_11]|nr:MAG: protein-(glutamine-N5) methyltransferase, release factor-specific [Deltaproteobacteria bacterium GWC2_42_11]